MGKLFSDAGGNFVYANNLQSGSVSLSFESVFQQAHNADIWLIKYGAEKDLTYADMALENANYTRFRAYKQHKIWGCNLFRVPFFEEGAFHPERILHDLIEIFHPSMIGDNKMYFFSPLQ